jgi:hypothetical protein
MSCRLCLCLALWATTASAGLAGIPTDAFTISLPGGKRYLCVRGGALTVGAAPGEVDRERRPAPGRWYVEGTRIKSGAGAGYLAYHSSGEDPRVFLTHRLWSGTEWDIRVPEKSRSAEGKRAVIRAASGKFKGWVLTVEVVKEKGPGGKVVVTERAVLARDPKRRLEVERIFSGK